MRKNVLSTWWGSLLVACLLVVVEFVAVTPCVAGTVGAENTSTAAPAMSAFDREWYRVDELPISQNEKVRLHAEMIISWETQARLITH